MAYGIDLRKRVIAFYEQGHTREERSKVFNVGTATIQRRLSLLSEAGSLEKRPLNRSAPTFPSKKLEYYMEEHPDALLKDIAQHFGGSTTGAFHALNREKITYKKRDFLRDFL